MITRPLAHPVYDRQEEEQEVGSLDLSYYQLASHWDLENCWLK